MIKDNFKFILIIACFYILLECVGITCPIKFITGISCAGCGMSRAWISLLKLDLKNAFYYHPLFWSIPILFGLVFLKNNLNKKVYNVSLTMIVSLYLIVYAVRLFSNNDIVVFEPENNILFRLIKGVM